MRRRILGLKVEEGKNNRSVVFVAAKTLKATSIDISPVENTKKTIRNADFPPAKGCRERNYVPRFSTRKTRRRRRRQIASSQSPSRVARRCSNSSSKSIITYALNCTARRTRQSVIAISVENEKTQVRLIGSSLTSSSRSLFSGSTGCPITDGFYAFDIFSSET